jgi:pimeloyl-ACP methyl ester carboxylesterase
MLTSATYPMPVYLGYILNAYTAYNQFSNPVTDIFNEPYASRVNNLYKGLLTSDQINSQLSTSIPLLITTDFISGFNTSQKYLSVRQAFDRNSIAAWHSYAPLLLIHGAKDSQVSPVSTENMYTTMIQAGTSADICKKVIVPDLDHSDGAAPCLVKGFLFLNNLNISK